MNPAPAPASTEQLRHLIPSPIPEGTLPGVPAKIDCLDFTVKGIISQRTALMDTLIKGRMKPTDKLQSADTCRSLLELTAVLSHERAVNLPETPEGQVDPLDRAIGLLTGSFSLTPPPVPNSRFSYAKDIYALLPEGERLNPEEIISRFQADRNEIDHAKSSGQPLTKDQKQRAAVSSLRMICLLGSRYDLQGKGAEYTFEIAHVIRYFHLGEEIGELIGLKFGVKPERTSPSPLHPDTQTPTGPGRISGLVDEEGFAADLPHLENLKKALLSDTGDAGQNGVTIDEHTILREGKTPQFSLAELMDNTRSPDAIRILASTGKTTLVAIRIPAVNINEPPNIAIIAVRQNQPPYLLKYEDERMEIYLGKDRPEHLNDAWRRQSTENTIFYISGSSMGEVKRLFILKDTGEIITYDTNKENVYFEITNTSGDKMTGIETTIGDNMIDEGTAVERREKECRFINFDGKYMQVDSVGYQGIQPSERPCFLGIYSTFSADGRESVLVEDQPGDRKLLVSSPAGIGIMHLFSYGIPESLLTQLAEVSLHAGNISGISAIEADCINSTTLLVQKMPDGTYRTGLISRRDTYKLCEPSSKVTTDPDLLESKDDNGETLVLRYQTQEPGQPGLWVREATETDITSEKELDAGDIARIIRQRAYQSTKVTSQFTHIPAGWLHPNEMADHLESVHYTPEKLAPSLLEVIRQEKLKAADELIKVVLDNISSTKSSGNFDKLVRRLKLLKSIKTASRSEEEIYQEDLVPMPAQWDETDPKNLDAMIQSRTTLILRSRRSTPKDLWAKSGTPALDEVCARAALEQIALYSWYAPDRSPKAIMGDLYYLTGVIDNKPQSHYSTYSFSSELFSILSAHDPENMMRNASRLHRVWSDLQLMQKQQMISDTPNRTVAAKCVIYTLACLGDSECMTNLTAERTQLMLDTLSEIISFQKLGPEIAGLVKKIPSPDETLTTRLVQRIRGL